MVLDKHTILQLILPQKQLSADDDNNKHTDKQWITAIFQQQGTTSHWAVSDCT